MQLFQLKTIKKELDGLSSLLATDKLIYSSSSPQTLGHPSYILRNTNSSTYIKLCENCHILTVKHKHELVFWILHSWKVAGLNAKVVPKQPHWICKLKK